MKLNLAICDAGIYSCTLAPYLDARSMLLSILGIVEVQQACP
jgi:hypothetical protein